MAMTGPPPKENPERRNAARFNSVEIMSSGRLMGPPLPRDYDWCDRTKDWWLTWRKSPQAMVMTDTDWETMLETAFLHNMLWNTNPQSANTFGNGRRNGAVSATQLAAEIRQRVAKMGATFEDRLKLRMSIKTPQSDIDDEDRIAQEASEAIDYISNLAKYAAEGKKK